MKDGLCLLGVNTRKPFQEFLQRSTVPEVLEQGAYRHPSAHENPSAANYVWVALHRIARSPVCHVSFGSPFGWRIYLLR